MGHKSQRKNYSFWTFKKRDNDTIVFLEKLSGFFIFAKYEFFDIFNVFSYRRKWPKCFSDLRVFRPKMYLILFLYFRFSVVNKTKQNVFPKSGPFLYCTIASCLLDYLKIWLSLEPGYHWDRLRAKVNKILNSRLWSLIICCRGLPNTSIYIYRMSQKRINNEILQFFW